MRGEEQKRNEETLNSSEALYKALFESTGAGAVLIEEDGTISLCNTRFEEITGFSRKEVEGKRNLMEFISKKEFERLTDFSRKTGDEHSLLPADFEVKLVNKRSELRDVIMNLNIIKESKQTIVTFFDITERKQIELHVQMEKDRAQRYLDVAAVMLVALDVNGNTTLINRKGCETLGYEESEILEKKWVDSFIPSQWRDNVKNVFSRLLHGDIELFKYYENPVLTKNGSERLIAWCNSVLKDEEQNIVGILCSGEDITNKRKTEEEIAFFYHIEQIFSRMSADFINMSINDIDQGINNSLEQIANFTGAYRSSLIRFSEDFEKLYCTHDWISESVDPLQQPFLKIPIDSFRYFIGILRKEEKVVAQYIKDLPKEATQEIKWMETNEIYMLILIPMIYEESLIGSIVIFHEMDQDQVRLERLIPLLQFIGDICVSALKRKETEEALKKHKDHLEELVKERTAELKQSNQELDAFTYTVSHDLRAPLRAMQGFSQALQEDYDSILDDEGKEFTTRIINAADKMNELITDLLNYSGIGRKKIDVIPLSLSKLIEDVLKQHEDKIKKSKSEITVEKIDCDILGQYSLVFQIIENLVSNALKFRKPEIDLTIKIWLEDYGDKIRFYIEDNGIGIDEKYFAKIFLVFERLHSTEKYPGTGIGLATVKKTAELLGGKVGVISTLGEGSTFWADFLKVKE